MVAAAILPTPAPRAAVVAAPSRWDALAFQRAVRDSGLDAREKLVAFALALRAGDGRCFPSVQRIATDVGMRDLRAIRAAIAELAKRGYVTVIAKSGAMNTYQLRCPAPPAPDAPPPARVPPARSAPPALDAGGAPDAPPPPAPDAPPPPASDARRNTQGNTQGNIESARTPANGGSQGSPAIPEDHPSGVRRVVVPTDIPITPELEASCQLAGAPKPTRDDVQLMLEDMKERGKTSLNYTASVVKWMIRQKAYDRGKSGRAPRMVQQPEPGTKPAWAPAAQVSDEQLRKWEEAGE